jgi:hypothetical protein
MFLQNCATISEQQKGQTLMSEAAPIGAPSGLVEGSTFLVRSPCAS